MPIKESKYIDKQKRLVMSRLVKRDEQNDRSFDREFWQRLTDSQRLDAAWDMVVFAHTSKGKDPDELRLQRSVEKLKRR